MESWSYKDALTQFVISKVSRCEEAAEILNPTELITPSEFETECGTIAVSVIATKPHSTNPDDIHLRVVLVERRAAVTNRKVNPEYAVYGEHRRYNSRRCPMLLQWAILPAHCGRL